MDATTLYLIEYQDGHATGDLIAGGSTVPDGFVPVEPHKDTFPGADDDAA